MQFSFQTGLINETCSLLSPLSTSTFGSLFYWLFTVHGMTLYFKNNFIITVYLRCVIGSVYQKLYPVICSKCTDEDDRMLTKCRNLSGLTPDHLGVPKHFCCPVTSAVSWGLFFSINRQTWFNLFFFTFE